jgi:putative transposase
MNWTLQQERKINTIPVKFLCGGGGAFGARMFPPRRDSMNSESCQSGSVHGVGQIVFHFEWCPKYRYNMLRQDKYKDLLATVLQREMGKMRCKIDQMGIQDNHVHLIVILRPSISVSEVFHRLKGMSSHELFEFEPKFRLRYPKGHFWSPGKFYRSVGDIDLETAQNYVKKQDHRQKMLAM